jgi:hypothetical protein
MRQTMAVIDRKIAAEQKKDSTFNASRMAKRMRVDPSLFSRWRKHDEGTVNRETLNAMLLGFSEDVREQAELLAAFLRDQNHGPGSELVVISVKTTGRVKKT